MRTKFLLMWISVLFFISSVGLNAQTDNGNSRSWHGIIVNNTCTMQESLSELPQCTEEGVPGAKLAIFDDSIRKVYLLDPQDLAKGHLGNYVIVTGTLEDITIHVATLKMFTSSEIGLSVGQKAPAFSARDQFGQEQRLETLKGPKGTLLLVFRSADW
jgi:hypothetical protein